MIYKLKNEINKNYSATEQVLTNRGIRLSDIKHYLNTSDLDINSPLLFGEDKMRAAAAALISAIEADQEILIIVD